MVSPALFSSDTGEWATPIDLFDRLDAQYHFTLDAAATEENSLCDRFMTGPCVAAERWLQCECGLCGSWGQDQTVWLNPPYGRDMGKWIAKAALEAPRNLVVMLLPSRTDTRWFHESIWDRDRSRPYRDVSVDFLKGRLKFGGSENPAPFPSMLVTFS